MPSRTTRTRSDADALAAWAIELLTQAREASRNVEFPSKAWDADCDLFLHTFDDAPLPPPPGDRPPCKTRSNASSAATPTASSRATPAEPPVPFPFPLPKGPEP